MAEESDFLSGRKTNWRADFNWLMNETNMVKVIEGNYKNMKNRNSGTYTQPQRNYEEVHYDFPDVDGPFK